MRGRAISIPVQVNDVERCPQSALSARQPTWDVHSFAFSFFRPP